MSTETFNSAYYRWRNQLAELRELKDTMSPDALNQKRIQVTEDIIELCPEFKDYPNARGLPVHYLRELCQRHS